MTPVPATTPAQWLREAPFTLALSAGFFGFFSHAGVLAALEAAGVRPQRIVGVSAGALAGGLWAAGLGADAIATELLALRRSDFWDPGMPLGGLLRGHKFDAQLRRVLMPTGVTRLEDCATEFVSVAHDVVGRQTVALRHGDLATAIRASCTVPLMFRPLWWEGRVVVDGGVSDRIGRIALPDAERVLLHYLPSRSRWRRAPSPTSLLGLDARVVVTPDVPPLGPFSLGAAARAIEVSRAHAQAWLHAPI